MSGDILLSSLCTICHLNQIKYTCPRCGVHTCSLPCVTKHKKWAQCSGVRDPAEYRKRSDLETASSVDKDFNFITKVERSLAQAESIPAAQGLATSFHKRARPQEHRTNVEIGIEERGVHVIRAPRGLSRQRQNKTHWANQHKCLMWTIEWICPDGQKIVGQGLEFKSVEEAFTNAVGKKNTLRKRKRSNQPSSLGSALKQNGAIDEQEAIRPNILKNVNSQLSNPRIELKNQALSQAGVQSRQDLNPEDKSNPFNVESFQPELHFYLLRPNTSSRIKCLVPLRSDSSIQKSLEGRTVLEFPTIYVRSEGPTQLPPSFVLESDYIANYDQAALVDMTTSLEEGEIDDGHPPLPSVLLNESKVVEVLTKDLSKFSET